MTVTREWIDQKAKQKNRLYEQYGKELEEKHIGEYVAISTDGETILGDRMGEVLHEAIETFGNGNFAIARIGHRTLARWLTISTS